MNPVTYQIKRSNRSLSISIRVGEKGVVVSAPSWVPEIAIKHFVKSKEDWILSHLSRIPQINQKSKIEYVDGEKHLLFGQGYLLKIIQKPNLERTKIVLSGEFIEIHLWQGHVGDVRQKEIAKAMLSWYLETGIEAITAKVNHYAELIGVTYSSINLKKVSSIWGSCSPSNELCFNRKLIQAPHEVIDYVIVHEVSHLVHRNHSSRFWGLVARYSPMFRLHRQWLRRNHHLLTI